MKIKHLFVCAHCHKEGWGHSYTDKNLKPGDIAFFNPDEITSPKGWCKAYEYIADADASISGKKVTVRVTGDLCPECQKQLKAKPIDANKAFEEFLSNIK